MARILVIDDSPTVIAALTRTLEREGHRVSSVSDAPAFYAKVREFDPDLVFLDLEMPGMSGRQIGEFLGRFHKKETPIVILSARPREELESAAREIRAAAFLEKSQGSIAISNTVRSVLLAAERRKNGESRRA